MNTTESVQEMVLLNKCGLTMFVVILRSLSVDTPKFNGKLFLSHLSISSNCPQKGLEMKRQAEQEK